MYEKLMKKYFHIFSTESEKALHEIQEGHYQKQ